jgi:intermediate filament protein if
MSDDHTIVPYRSNIAPRATTIVHRRGLAAGRVGQLYSPNNQVAQNSYAVPLKPRNPAVQVIAENRDREKRELMNLNDKFASYVERVRFLEVHNRKLQMELDDLRKRSNNEAGTIRNMYETELTSAKILIDDTSKAKANAEVKAKQNEVEVDKFKKRFNDVQLQRQHNKSTIDDLNKQISHNEAEINLLRRRLSDLEDEAKRYKIETQRLLGEIQRITSELDAETLQRVQLENEHQSLSEELSFLKQKHAQQLEDLRQNSFLDIGLDSSQFFKSELTNAIREIRSEYEQINNDQRQNMEQWYRTKIQEIQNRHKPEAAEVTMAREETKRLRSAVNDQRHEIANIKARNGELEARIKGLEELIAQEDKDGKAQIADKDAEIRVLSNKQAEIVHDFEQLAKLKTSLENEIEQYRCLLEGDGKKEGLKAIVENIEDRARNNLLNVVPHANAAPLHNGVHASTDKPRIRILI